MSAYDMRAWAKTISECIDYAEEPLEDWARRSRAYMPVGMLEPGAVHRQPVGFRVPDAEQFKGTGPQRMESLASSLNYWANEVDSLNATIDQAKSLLRRMLDAPPDEYRPAVVAAVRWLDGECPEDD